MPCWIRNTSEIPVEVAKDRDLPTKVGWRWKVKEEGRKVTTTIEQLVEVPVVGLVHGKLDRATNKVFARWVFDHGVTQPGSHYRDRLTSIYQVVY